MNSLLNVTKTLIRIAVVWTVDALSLLLVSFILPGFNLTGTEEIPAISVAAAAALLLGLINILIRPIILLLALPFGFIVIFIAGFLVNAIVLMITATILPGFTIDGWLSALLGALILAAINTIIITILTINDDDSFYQGIIERVAMRSQFPISEDEGQALLMMEIDGLSYWHIQKAIDDGRMPTLKRMMDEDGYVLSRIDCGLPSQTSACQAGIMFGDNYDIPAFRWYDKDQGKLMVSGHDAAEINARYAHGNGLMREGSSINNMMNGDAAKSLLTLADLTSGSEDEKKQRADDIYLLMLNPYFLMRTIVLFFGDVLLELWQYWRQVRKDVQPRLNRLHGGYPFIRAATTVFMRDISAYLTILDIVRGSPSLYITWPGYDEVAHHSGPWTSDAFGVLHKYDRVIARVQHAIERKAPRPYELILLSDHGQSFGATFKQRYGYDLKTFIETQLPIGTSVQEAQGGDDGTLTVTAMAGELDNVQEQGVGGQVGQRVVKRTQRFLRNNADRRETPLPEGDTDVIVCGSGNLAQVYFDLAPKKLSVIELNDTYPGVVDALAQHEGIGFVVGYEQDGTPVAFGKTGARNLHTNAIVGEDPFIPYGDTDLRSAQARRIADFPHAGDLIVNSTVFADGTVAAMEELIGNHGGMGGEQTDAFMLHPGDMDVPETMNSIDVFHILNNRRGLHRDGSIKAKPRDPDVPTVNPWSWTTLSTGIRNVQLWGRLAVHALLLDREAYKEIVRDPYNTGPALLLMLIGTLVFTIVSENPSPQLFFLRIGLWLLGILLVLASGRILGGTGTFTSILRGIGFAEITHLWGLIGLIPALSEMAFTVTAFIVFISTWIAGATAHKLEGWRTLFLPVVMFVLPIVTAVILANLIEGTILTVEALLQMFGYPTLGS